MEVQTAQVPVEVLRKSTGPVRTAQVAAEVIRSHGVFAPTTRAAQVATEVLRESSTPAVRAAQVTVEVLRHYWFRPETVYLEEFRVIKCRVTNETILFTLGLRVPFHLQFPRWRFSRKLCRWTTTAECPYALTCAKTLQACIDNDETLRFGGFPAIPGGVFDA